MNNLFAFNVSQEVPVSEMLDLSGTYDPEQQGWLGAGETRLQCSGSYTCSRYCSYQECYVCWWCYPPEQVCDCMQTDCKSDYADCE